MDFESTTTAAAGPEVERKPGMVNGLAMLVLMALAGLPVLGLGLGLAVRVFLWAAGL